MGSGGGNGPPWGALVVYALLFGAAFAVSSRAVTAVMPGRGTTLIETKLAWFEEHRAQYDTLFFGSSRAYRGFEPERFDRLTAEAGIETRSFNFGTPGSRAFEVYRMLDRIEELDLDVRWVFVDPERLEWLRQKDEDMLVRSYIEWHDVPTTMLVVAYILDQDLPLLDKLDRLKANLRACGYHIANIGSTEELVDTLLGRVVVDRTNQVDRLGARLDGWLPLSPETATQREKKNQNFNTPERQEAFRDKVEKLRADEVDDEPVAPSALAFFSRIERKIESMGAVPIFVTQPGVKLQHDLIKAHRDGKIRYLLRYDDPDEVPELFLSENRWDQHHLRTPGAEIFTAMLARDFIELYEEASSRQ